MGKIEKFEDLEAWQKARTLVNEIYRVSSDRGFSKDFALREQIRRSAISVPANIAEGFARKTTKEFIQFLFIAHGSIAEVESQLYIALDLGYINKTRFEEIYKLCYECSRLVMGLIKYLKSTQNP